MTNRWSIRPLQSTDTSLSLGELIYYGRLNRKETKSIKMVHNCKICHHQLRCIIQPTQIWSDYLIHPLLLVSCSPPAKGKSHYKFEYKLSDLLLWMVHILIIPPKSNLKWWIYACVSVTFVIRENYNNDRISFLYEVQNQCEFILVKYNSLN